MSEHETTSEASGEPTRRDFLYLTTGMAGAVGAAAVAWPFIDQMRPDASTLALASIEVDVSSLGPGMSLTAKWRGKPVFIRNRTPEEVKAADEVPLSDLKDPIARNAEPSGRSAGNRCRPLCRQGQGKLDRHDRFVHASRLRAARTGRRIQRLVLSLPWLGHTTRPAASVKVRRRRTCRFRPIRSFPIQ